MRFRRLAAFFVLVSAFPGLTGSQGRPDFSGTWTLSAGAPIAANGKPVAAPGFGPQITIWQDGSNFTVTRMFAAGQVATVTHVLDGSRTISRTPGGLCQGDSQ